MNSALGLESATALRVEVSRPPSSCVTAKSKGSSSEQQGQDSQRKKALCGVLLSTNACVIGFCIGKNAQGVDVGIPQRIGLHASASSESSASRVSRTKAGFEQPASKTPSNTLDMHIQIISSLSALELLLHTHWISPLLTLNTIFATD